MFIPRFHRTSTLWERLSLRQPWVYGASPRRLAKPPGGGTPPPLTNPAIAFVTTQTDTRQDVVVASGDLASQIVLTQTLQTKRKGGGYTHLFGDPAWSADGGKVAFWATNQTDPKLTRTQLYTVNANGTQMTLIRDFRLRPSVHQPQNGPLNWSPSGLELVYESMAHAIVAIAVGTGDIRVLLDAFSPMIRYGKRRYSPDLDDAAGYQGMVAMRGRDGSVDVDGTPQFDIFVAPIVSGATDTSCPSNAT